MRAILIPVQTRTIVTCLIALLAWSAVAQPPTPAPAPESPALQRTLEKLRALQTAPRQAPIPGWQILRSQDAMSDVVEYDAVQTTDGGQMVVFCSVGGRLPRLLSFAFHTTPFMGERSTTSLTYRVDNAPADEVVARFSNKTAFIADSKEKFLKAVTARDAKRLLIRFRTWNNNSVDLAFDISGVVSVTERLRDLCTPR
jgi:hypothetical protein